jgi:hypothetical protein
MHIDQMVACGFSTAKMIVAISLVSHAGYNPARPYMGDIDADIVDMCTNWDTDNASYADKVATLSTFDSSDLTLSADDTHFVSSAIELMGDDFSTIFGPHRND